MGKREETQQRIIAAAVKIIAEKGYSAAKTQEIAQMAGTSEATVFKYFKSKNGILEMIVNHAVKTFGQEIALNPIAKILEIYRDAPFEEVLDHVIEDRLKMLDKQTALLTIMLKEMQYHPEIKKKIVDEIYLPISQLFSSFYEHQVTIGNVRHVDSTAQLFQTLTTIFVAPIARRLIINQEVVSSELEREYSAIKEIILRGVRVL